MQGRSWLAGGVGRFALRGPLPFACFGWALPLLGGIELMLDKVSYSSDYSEWVGGGGLLWVELAHATG